FGEVDSLPLEQRVAQLDAPRAELFVLALPAPGIGQLAELWKVGGHIAPGDEPITKVEDALKRIAEHARRQRRRELAHERVLYLAAILIFVNEDARIRSLNHRADPSNVEQIGDAAIYRVPLAPERVVVRLLARGGIRERVAECPARDRIHVR